MPPSPNPTPSVSAPSATTWHRSLELSVAALTADAEGNAYVTGFVPRGADAHWAMVLEKLGPDGARLWTVDWPSPSRRYPHAAGFGVAVSPDAAIVYVVGAVMNDSTEVRLARLWAYSPEGELLWSVRTDRSGMSFAAGAGDSGVVAGGSGWLGAWGSDGGRLWAVPFEDPGGDHCDAVQDVDLADRGQIYVVGFLDTTPTCWAFEGGGFEDADIVVQRRSPSGTLLWSRVLTDPEVDNDRGLAVDVDGGRVFVSGQKDGHAWLARFSTDGQTLWERSWGDPRMTVSAVDVSAAPWGPVYVVADRRRGSGSARGTSILRRYTPAGNLAWGRRRSLGPDEIASSIATAQARVLYVTTTVFSSGGDLRRVRP